MPGQWGGSSLAAVAVHNDALHWGWGVGGGGWSGGRCEVVLVVAGEKCDAVLAVAVRVESVMRCWP